MAFIVLHNSVVTSTITNTQELSRDYIDMMQSSSYILVNTIPFRPTMKKYMKPMKALNLKE